MSCDVYVLPWTQKLHQHREHARTWMGSDALRVVGAACKRGASVRCRVPRSQRGGEVIEPLVSEQWFVRMEVLAAPALKAVEAGDIAVTPERFKTTYARCLEDIQDWCISRQLWWGHRIPVWYCFDSEAEAETEGGRSERWVVAADEAEARALVRRLCTPLSALRCAERCFCAG